MTFLWTFALSFSMVLFQTYGYICIQLQKVPQSKQKCISCLTPQYSRFTWLGLLVLLLHFLTLGDIRSPITSSHPISRPFCFQPCWTMCDSVRVPSVHLSPLTSLQILSPFFTSYSLFIVSGSELRITSWSQFPNSLVEFLLPSLATLWSFVGFLDLIGKFACSMLKL